YLAAKSQTLTRFSRHPLLLVVNALVQEQLPTLQLPTVTYKSAIKISDVLQRLNEISATQA
ncbi:MAG: hypothetical protein KDA59_10070, partial [Planctomycetales bacterium]|nr:hypothetical protein [Planctomycetales bacterium]